MFATDSPRAGAKGGKQPYWPMTITRMFIKPVAKKLGIGNISWHTFRHTYSNLLRATEKDPKVVQELLRHSSIKITMDITRRLCPLRNGEPSREWWSSSF